jgi:hypothetical protein
MYARKKFVMMGDGENWLRIVPSLYFGTGGVKTLGSATRELGDSTALRFV